MRKILALSFGLFVCCIILASYVIWKVGKIELAEIVSMEMLPEKAEPCRPHRFDLPDGYEQWGCHSFSTVDPDVGPMPRPLLSSRHKKVVDNKTSFDVEYTTDSFGRRNTPQGNDESFDRFLLFFGCSQTFGLGLNDNETLPAFVAERMKGTRCYNYGVPGYGPHNMLAKLEKNGIRKEVAEKKGALIFQFIDSHIERIAGAPQYYDSFSHPYYSLDKNGALKHQGNFLTGRPYKTMLYRILGRAGLLSPFGMELGFTPREKHYRLTEAIFNEARLKFKEKFGSDEFYVLIFPDKKSSITRNMTERLERSEVRCLNYLDLFDGTLDKYQIPNDGHPNALADLLMAKQIAKDFNGK